MNKVCHSCKENKNINEFAKNKSKKDGYGTQCKSCKKLYDKAYRIKNREKLISYLKKHYSKNKEIYLQKYKENYKLKREHIRKLAKTSYYKNQEQRISDSKRFRKNNPNYDKQYKKRGKGLINTRIQNAKRRAAELKAVPKWLTNEHKQEIKRIYENCPNGYQVDHIIPLINSEICGLHVPWNLQYLTVEENNKKGNKYDPQG